MFFHIFSGMKNHWCECCSLSGHHQMAFYILPPDGTTSLSTLVCILLWTTDSSVAKISHVHSLRRSDDICLSKLTIIGSDNGLSPARRQAIIWTNAGILLTESIGTKFNVVDSYIFIQENPVKDIAWEMSAILSRPQCVICPCLGKVRIFKRGFWLAVSLFDSLRSADHFSVSNP